MRGGGAWRGGGLSATACLAHLQDGQERPRRVQAAPSRARPQQGHGGVSWIAGTCGGAPGGGRGHGWDQSSPLPLAAQPWAHGPQLGLLASDQRRGHSATLTPQSPPWVQRGSNHLLVHD